MNHELIDRYIYAVTRRLPMKLRGDVEQELASLISDMLEARCGAVVPTENDIRVVLTELGAPTKLAAKYSGDEGGALISGEYFLMYKFVLKLVLPIAAGGVAFASLLSLLLGGGAGMDPWLLAGKTFGEIFAGIVGGTIQAFAIVTFVFAVLEHKKVVFGGSDFIDSLPQVPVKNERVKPWEPIAGMVWCVVAAVVFLGFPQVMGGRFGAGWMPAFDVAALRALWLPIALWMALGIGKEIVRLAEGRYTRRLLIVTLAADLATAACAAVVFLPGKIMNPAFAQNVGVIFNEPFLTKFFVNFNQFFLGLVIAALVIEIVTVSVKAWRYGRDG